MTNRYILSENSQRGTSDSQGGAAMLRVEGFIKMDTFVFLVYCLGSLLIMPSALKIMQAI